MICFVSLPSTCTATGLNSGNTFSYDNPHAWHTHRATGTVAYDGADAFGSRASHGLCSSHFCSSASHELTTCMPLCSSHFCSSASHAFTTFLCFTCVHNMVITHINPTFWRKARCCTLWTKHNATCRTAHESAHELCMSVAQSGWFAGEYTWCRTLSCPWTKQR